MCVICLAYTSIKFLGVLESVLNHALLKKRAFKKFVNYFFIKIKKVPNKSTFDIKIDFTLSNLSLLKVFMPSIQSRACFGLRKSKNMFFVHNTTPLVHNITPSHETKSPAINLRQAIFNQITLKYLTLIMF